MPSGDDFQVSVQAAEVYESEFVPALFGRWAPHLVEAAEVAPGRSVLDVACGTGVVAREAARRTRARVVGIDVNPGMLAVARRVEPGIEWLEADAVALPFPDGSFDTVLCQASLMFVPEPERALGEMARVVAPGGTVAVQVWDRLETQVGWEPFYATVQEHAGADAIGLISTYWRLGDVPGLTASCARAGLQVTRVLTRTDTASFRSVEDFVATEITGTPLGDRLAPETQQRILEDTRPAMAPYRSADGRLDVPIQGHILVARPSASTTG